MVQRLQKLGAEADRAACSQDEEAIHDLRVAIRRFSQGLLLFPDLLPEADSRKIRKRLKRVMNLTSEIRNRDIALQRVGLDEFALRDRLTEERAAFAAKFQKRAMNWRSWQPDASTAENAAEALPQLLREFFEAGRQTSNGEKTYRELHRFRVRTKRFRYALEMFADVYGPALEKRLKHLQQLQKILGKISDAFTIRELLRDDGDYRDKLAAEGGKYIEQFRRYWAATFDAPGEFEAWLATLSTSVTPAA